MLKISTNNYQNIRYSTNFCATQKEDLHNSSSNPKKELSTTTKVVCVGATLALATFCLCKCRNKNILKINDLTLEKTKKGSKVTLKNGDIEHYNLSFEDARKILKKKEALPLENLRAIVRKSKKNLHMIEFYQNGILQKVVGYKKQMTSLLKFKIKKDTANPNRYLKITRDGNIENHYLFDFNGQKASMPFDFTSSTALKTTKYEFLKNKLLNTLEFTENNSNTSLSVQKVENGYRYLHKKADKLENIGFIETEKPLTIEEFSKEFDKENGVICTKKDGVFKMFRLDTKGVEIDDNGKYISITLNEQGEQIRKEVNFNDVKDLIQKVKKLCGLEA